MNEEIESAINKIKDNVAQWNILNIHDHINPQKTALAEQLQFQLTMLKIMIGINNFDELSYFKRVLKQIDSYLDKADSEYQKDFRVITDKH